MKITVEIHQLNSKRGFDEKVGDIVYEDGEIKASNDEAGLKAILSRPAYDKDGKEIDRETQPELWMHNLCWTYRSPYFRALLPVQRRQSVD